MMQHQDNYTPLVTVAIVGALGAPTLLLLGDVLQVLGDRSIAYTVLLWLAFVVWLPPLAALVLVTYRRAPVLTLVGGVIVLIGTVAGASMQVAFRARVLLGAAGHVEAQQFVRTSGTLALTTQVPGIGFPIGLIILAAALARARLVPGWIPGTLMLGALLFPIGHAVGVPAALIAGDLVLLTAFWSLAVNAKRLARTSLRHQQGVGSDGAA